MKAFFTRRVAVPVWAVAVAGLVIVSLVAAAGGPEDSDTDVAAGTTTTALAPEPSASPAAVSTVPSTTAATLATTSSAPTTAPAKRWVEVTTATGSAEKRTPSFRLTGAETRMRYGAKAGFFAVYVVEQGDSLEASGGFPEVTCTADCADETRLAKGAGEYYLEVKAAGGSWTVVVEELR